MQNSRNILKSSSGVAFATLLSRLLGLLRVMLEASILGGGALASAWQLAVMIPNLFRRLLGEGALGSALVPMISHSLEQNDIMTVRRQLAVIFAVLGAVLTVIVLVVSLLSYVVKCFVSAEYVIWALDILPLVMPYAFFICLTGIIGAILNTRRIFFLPALGALLLNVMIIALLLLVAKIGNVGPMRLLSLLSLTVLLAGIIQFVLMVVLLKRSGIYPSFYRHMSGNLQVLKDLCFLALPGLIGASATQISFVIDRSLAAWLGPHAVPALSYTDRLVDIPIGIFAMALSAVLLADMSKSAAKKDFSAMIESLSLGMRYVFFICIPLAVFIVVFRVEIIRLLFLHGKFTLDDLRETAWATLFLSLGIPAFCTTKVILPMFYARKEMTKPLYVSLCAIGCNIILNLILMIPLRQGGLALATVLSAMINNAALLFILRKEGFKIDFGKVGITFGKALVISLVAAGVFFAYGYLQGKVGLEIMHNDLLPLLISGVSFVVIYLGLSYVFKCPEVWEIGSLLLHRKR